MAMPTQRPPFFASFFGAFRARTNPTFQAKSSTPSSISANAHVSTTVANATSTTSRSITTSDTSNNQFQSQNPQNSLSQAIPPSSSSTTTNKPSSAFSTAAFTSTSPGPHHHSHSPFYSPRSPGTSSPTANAHGQTIPLTRGRQRRGSDSSNSSGGFMDALGSGSDKWYIGGRTTGGDERFYRLGVVTAGGAAGNGRATSLDRLSL